jgi:plastocyanin
MIWRWLICFSLTAQSATAVEVSGQVQLRDSREPAVRKSGDFSGVVISLHPKDRSNIPNQRGKHAKMLQKQKTFIPHVLPIQVGTTVDFPNLDPIFHNAFSSYSGQIFDVSLYPPGTTRSVTFERPGVVRVFCNIHSSMSAVIIVLDTPYFTTTGKDGRFTLDVPAGQYELHVFHERATDQILNSLTRAVQVGSEPVHLAPIVVSEAGYLPAPHMNKYGKPYPPESDERSVYPGVRK